MINFKKMKYDDAILQRLCGDWQLFLYINMNFIKKNYSKNKILPSTTSPCNMVSLNKPWKSSALHF